MVESSDGNRIVKHWRQALINGATSIIDAMRAIDRAALQLALVVDVDDTLLGIVTDGDIRRGLLCGKTLADPISTVMNRRPVTGNKDDSREHLMHLMRRHSLNHIPIVDDRGRIISLQTLSGILKLGRKPNPVVLMAGGLGSRLGMLTRHFPKPMLNIGKKPILESIMTGFIDAGFYYFFLSVNYKAELIESYFGDGSRWDVQIDYLREQSPLGTAGPLSLLPEVSDDVMVMNGDILTKVDFDDLLGFHQSRGVAATMCVRTFDYQIPYGVIETRSHELAAIHEKPVQQFDVNAGIYVLSPEVVRAIPAGRRYDMNRVFEQALVSGTPVSVYPLQDYWIDVGQIDDFNRASEQFGDRVD